MRFKPLSGATIDMRVARLDALTLRCRDHTRLRIEVANPRGDRPPLARAGSTTAQGGLGLLLVDALADD